MPAGAVAVLINYALMLGVRMDELAGQCREAVVWVLKNAKSFGGDPHRIFISGHSAGGHLAALVAATDWSLLASDLPSDLIKRHNMPIKVVAMPNHHHFSMLKELANSQSALTRALLEQMGFHSIAPHDGSVAARERQTACAKSE